MSEHASRQKSGRPSAPLVDLALIVCPPGRPGDIQAFTERERADAELYAAEVGATVEPLPLT
ncbi:hypothetical protein [Mycolicibacterium vaccae]|uniref:hypothetical protein n=1 Tax=Mycolicibacterium vaccae TaxID=1810 RepID=UPI003CFBFC74